MGIIFGTMPDGVIAFFNNLSKPLSLPGCPEAGFNFYLILAVAYMYLVTVLAVMMYRFPGNKYFPILLINAKLASSIISFALFVSHSRYLVLTEKVMRYCERKMDIGVKCCSRNETKVRECVERQQSS